MLTIKEVIKTFYNALLQRLKKHRGNWEQNDPVADDYIKNRPFYTDETKKIVNVPEQKITIPSGNPFAQLVLPELIEFATGHTYEVKWDNKTYSCVAFDMDGIGTIGNQGLFGDGTDTGEPFIMMISKAEGMGMVAAPIGTHTVEVTSVKIVKIDKKYLPDLGLAPVATSGSYWDLENIPTTYSDVVRYSTSQSLSASQQQTARTNIGAAATSDLATVANTGDYNDLENKPCSKIFIDSPWSTFNWYSSTSVSPAGNSFNNIYSSRHVIEYEKPIAWGLFKPSAQGGEAYLVSDYMLGIKIGSRYYWGNLSLYDSQYADTGETWCIYAEYTYSTPCYAYIYYSEQSINTYVVEYSYRETTIQQLSEELIPDTIARVSELPQSDWSINDASNVQYINNRTHFIETTVGNTILSRNGGKGAETSLGDIDNLYTTLSTLSNISWSINGTEFSGEVRYYTHTNSNGTFTFWYAGNLSLNTQDASGAPDTGEDYLFYTYKLSRDQYNTYYGSYINGAVTLYSDKLIIKHPDVTIVHQLDEKFIPSTIARTEYVDNKVADLVNTAPEALDTLKELSTALGDDPNFATTVLTELSNKANKTDIKQADWNQSNENDNSYVRNRTHYVYVEEKVIVPETTAATTTLYSGNGFDIPNPSCENPFIEGGAYIVTWNGVDYNVIATEDSSATALYVQENGLLAVGFMPDEPNIIRVVTDDAIGTVNTLKVICHVELVNCLDEKYIPDTIARKSDIENFESNVQPDWNQNNETEPDYIKNRPFYYRTKTYELTGISQQLSSSYISLRDLYDIRNTEIDFDDNKSYRVTLDIAGSLSEEENNVNTFHCEMTSRISTNTYYGYSSLYSIATSNFNGIDYKYELSIVDASYIDASGNSGNVSLRLTTTPSGKSQLITDIKIKLEEIQNLEEDIIPDTIARTENIPVIDTTLTVSGAAADAKAVEEKILSPKHYITMIDQVSGHTYILSMEDGNLVSKIGIKHISVTTPPNLAEYTHGEYFDPTGMIVTATYYDDTTVDITGYTYPTSFLNSNVQPKITYTEFGITYEAIIPITINVFDPSTILVDFNYVDNKDGTYTLVGWKGTCNGEPSDKLIIPDYACIII